MLHIVWWPRYATCALTGNIYATCAPINSYTEIHFYPGESRRACLDSTYVQILHHVRPLYMCSFPGEIPAFELSLNPRSMKLECVDPGQALQETSSRTFCTRKCDHDSHDDSNLVHARLRTLRQCALTWRIEAMRNDVTSTVDLWRESRVR